MTRDEYHAILSARFPVSSKDSDTALLSASLEHVEVVDRPNGELAVVVRLIVWQIDREADTRSIRDIKEQEVYAGPPVRTSRFAAFTGALVRVLEEALTSADVERLMPHDLMNFTPLKLKATTEDEFAKALRMKSRLGKYLPTDTAPR